VTDESCLNVQISLPSLNALELQSVDPVNRIPPSEAMQLICPL